MVNNGEVTDSAVMPGDADSLRFVPLTSKLATLGQEKKSSVTISGPFKQTMVSTVGTPSPLKEPPGLVLMTQKALTVDDTSKMPGRIVIKTGSVSQPGIGNRKTALPLHESTLGMLYKNNIQVTMRRTPTRPRPIFTDRSWSSQITKVGSDKTQGISLSVLKGRSQITDDKLGQSKPNVAQVPPLLPISSGMKTSRVNLTPLPWSHGVPHSSLSLNQKLPIGTILRTKNVTLPKDHSPGNQYAGRKETPVIKPTHSPAIILSRKHGKGTKPRISESSALLTMDSKTKNMISLKISNGQIQSSNIQQIKNQDKLTFGDLPEPAIEIFRVSKSGVKRCVSSTQSNMNLFNRKSEPDVRVFNKEPQLDDEKEVLWEIKQLEIELGLEEQILGGESTADEVPKPEMESTIKQETVKEENMVGESESPMESQLLMWGLNDVVDSPEDTNAELVQKEHDNENLVETVKDEMIKKLPLQSKEKLDFIPLLQWQEEVGSLGGDSQLKFRVNEFAALEIIAEDPPQSPHGLAPIVRHHSRKATLRDEGLPALEKSDSVKSQYSICRCENCGCYGLSSEFYEEGMYCSMACGEEFNSRPKDGEKSSSKPESMQQVSQNTLNSNIKETEESVKSGDTLLEISTISHPWLDQSKRFSWVKYLEFTGRGKGQVRAAPLKLWPEPFPFGKNLFRTGMKMEAIDPWHQSLFCVVTVDQILGHRILLSFDGYSPQFRFWTNANSRNIFPVGWCEKNGRQLQAPPRSHHFSWKSYLEKTGSPSAPRLAFPNRNLGILPPNNFRAGMKLEAEDRKNLWVCVATVTDAMDNRVLVHFDGWDTGFDFWTEVTSPYIHPVGWCAENGMFLYPPKDYCNAENFSWMEYLRETNALAVPARAFKPRPPRGFRKGMKLEAVDRRNPMLVRVATVVDVQEYQVRVHFDGWAEEFDTWVEDDSPDLHPPTWCAKTGHPLQPPLTPEDEAAGVGCGTPGCQGLGHIKGLLYTCHHTLFGCPYSAQNMEKDPDSPMVERLTLGQPSRGKRAHSASPPHHGDGDDSDNGGSASKRVRKRRKFFDEITCIGSHMSRRKMARLSSDDGMRGSMLPVPSPTSSVTLASMSDVEESKGSLVSREVKSQSQSTVQFSNLSTDVSVHQSVFNPGYHPDPPMASPPQATARSLDLLNGYLGDVRGSDVAQWTVEQVHDFIVRIPGCECLSDTFVQEVIDGQALLLLTQSDIVNIMNIKLGPAIKIMSAILCIRKR